MEFEQLCAQYPAIATKVEEELGKIKQTKLNKKSWAAASESWDRMFPEDLQKLSQEISSATVYNKTLIVTPTAVLIKEFAALKCIPMRDLVWVFPQSTTQRMNFIPTAKYHHMRFIERSGQEYVVLVGQTGGFSKKQIGNDILSEIAPVIQSTRPGVFIGYSKELEAYVRGNLPAAAAAVDEKSQVQ